MKLQISSVRVSFSGTNKRIAFKLGLPVDQIIGSYHKKFVRVIRKVVMLEISRNRVRFSGTKERIAFKLGVQVPRSPEVAQNILWSLDGFLARL